MANYSNLKAAIAAAIKQNGNQEITGQVLQNVLTSMVSVIGANYTFAGVATPSTNPGTPDQNVVYMASQEGMYTNFGGIQLPAGISLLMWNGSWTSKTVMCGDGGVFDISVYKSSGGTLATFADISAALDGGNNIPASARKGGMSVKFVQSSDNKYVQYRLMSDSFNTTVANWQGVEATPTRNSLNLVNSDGILKSTSRLAHVIIYSNVLTITYSNSVFTVVIPKDTIIRAGNLRYVFASDTTFSFNKSDLGNQNTEILVIDISTETPTFSFFKTSQLLTANQFIVFGISLSGKKITLPDSYYTWGGKSEWDKYMANNVVNAPENSDKLVKASGLLNYASKKASVSLYENKIAVSYSSPNVSVVFPKDTIIKYGATGSYVFDSDTTFSVDKTTIGSVNIINMVFDSSNNSCSFLRGTGNLSATQYMLFSISINTKTISMPDTSYTWNGKNETLESLVKDFIGTFSNTCVVSLYNSPIKVSWNNPNLSIVFPANTKILVGKTTYTFGEDTTISVDRTTLSSANILYLVIDSNNNFSIKRGSYVLQKSEFLVFSISIYKNELSLPREKYIWNDNVGGNTDEMASKLYQTRKTVNSIKPLNILHFSDVHAWPSALQRVLNFKQSYSTYIDEVLHTGDNVRGTYESSDDFSYWGGVFGSENILNVIGNHDSAKLVDGQTDWRYYNDAQCYQMYFANYISNWGVTNPDNHCYYYKDYTTNGRSIRLIVLNEMMSDLTTQTTWLQGVLADAITNELHVMIASHSRKGSSITPLSINGRRCSFSFYGSMEGSVNYTEACAAVDTFIGNGGTFICWLLGHAHCTSVGYNEAYPNQLQIFADVAYPARFKDDVIRSVGNETEDSFHVVSIDQQAGMIRLIKVGTEYNKYMQHRNIMCYDYINRKLFSDNGDVFVDLT